MKSAPSSRSKRRTDSKLTAGAASLRLVPLSLLITREHYSILERQIEKADYFGGWTLSPTPTKTTVGIYKLWFYLKPAPIK